MHDETLTRVGDLKPGLTAYAPPYALLQFEDYGAQLDPEAVTFSTPVGRARMRVYRDLDGRFYADATRVADFVWRYLGNEEYTPETLIPVELVRV